MRQVEIQPFLIANKCKQTKADVILIIQHLQITIVFCQYFRNITFVLGKPVRETQLAWPWCQIAERGSEAEMWRSPVVIKKQNKTKSWAVLVCELIMLPRCALQASLDAWWCPHTKKKQNQLWRQLEKCRQNVEAGWCSLTRNKRRHVDRLGVQLRISLSLCLSLSYSHTHTHTESVYQNHTILWLLH